MELLHTKGHTSNPWNKCPKRGLLTTGGQIPIEKHYHSFHPAKLVIKIANVRKFQLCCKRQPALHVRKWYNQNLICFLYHLTNEIYSHTRRIWNISKRNAIHISQKCCILPREMSKSFPLCSLFVHVFIAVKLPRHESGTHSTVARLNLTEHALCTSCSRRNSKSKIGDIPNNEYWWYSK